MPQITIIHHPDIGKSMILQTQLEQKPNYRFLCFVETKLLIRILSELNEEFSVLINETNHSRNLLFVAEDDFVCKVSFQKKDDTLNQDSIQLINEIHKCIVQLQKKGVSLRTIREALLQYQELSEIQLTHSHQIYLPLYNIHIPIHSLPLSVYLLFLRHPEGIFLKNLSAYTDELDNIYSRLSPNSNPQRRKRSIASLGNPLSNSLNEKISQIRRAFANYLDETLVERYCITGTKGGIHLVTLPQQFLKIEL